MIYDIELQLLLVIESAMVFDGFLHIFQRTEPMIRYKLYDSIIRLVRKIAAKICLNASKSIKNLFSDENILQLAEINLSNDLQVKIEKFDEISKSLFRKNYISHFRDCVFN